MSEVASLELCKELFELSGWLTEKDYWSQGSIKNYPVKESRVDELLNYKPLWFDNPKENTGHVFPAYSLGYLLRKLPHGSRLVKGAENYYITNNVDGLYDKNCDADTPEDAACKLAIELFKQGIIK